ncbi:PIN domain-like protein, partial [Hesseltinella vesiculosa]
MGIQGLTGLLKRYAPQCLSRLSTPQVASMRLVVDASCPLNRFIYGDDTLPHRHIYGFYLMIKFCQHFGIHPIFVFDGSQRLALKQKWEHARRQQGRVKITHSLVYEQDRALRLDTMVSTMQSLPLDLAPGTSLRLLDELEGTPPPVADLVVGLDAELSQQQQDLEQQLRTIAIELRRALNHVGDTSKYTRTVRELSQREYEVAGALFQQELDHVHRELSLLQKENNRLLASLGKRSLRVTTAMKEQCIDFIRSLGYPCLICEGHEAEAMCAHIVEQGHAQATVSEDMDTVVFGDAPLIRHFFAKHQQILRVDPTTARQHLGLSKSQFLDLCILCGTDFGAKIHGIGPIRALSLVREHGSIEQILPTLDPRKYIPEQGFDYVSIRKLFQTLPSIPTDPQAYERQAADTALTNYLLHKYAIDEGQAEQQLKVILGSAHHQPDDFGPNPFT